MLIEHRHDRPIGRHQAASAIDQERDALERGAASQILTGQARPGLDGFLGRGRVPIARQIDQHEPMAEIEEIDLLGTPRRVGGAREVGPPGERVDEARFADVGTPGESDLGKFGRRQPFEISGARDERAGLREEKPAGF